MLTGSTAVKTELVWTVLDAMAEDIVSRDTITHSYPHDWRTKQPLITRASQQWFIDTMKLKRRALVGLIYSLSLSVK